MNDERPLKARTDEPGAAGAAARLLAQVDAETRGPEDPAARVRLLDGAERRIAKPARSPLRFVLVGATAVALAALAAFFVLGREPVRAVGGQLALGSGEALQPGDEIPVGARVRTQSGGELQLGKAVAIALEGDGSLTLDSLDTVVVEQGRSTFRVAPRKGRAPFRVKSRDVQIEVVGTAFSVAADGDAVLVAVAEGHVRVTRGTDTWLLGPGETWPPPAAQPKQPGVGVQQPPSQAPEPEPTEEQKAQVRARLTLLEKAADLLRKGQLAKARTIYRQLADEDVPQAEIALYNLSRLEMRKAKRPTAALAALDEQLERFPNGALFKEARLGRVEALRALGRKEEAAKASQEVIDAGVKP